MKIGFIGLGRMGKGMALRLLNGGHDLAVYDVFTPATEDFRSTRRESPRALRTCAGTARSLLPCWRRTLRFRRSRWVRKA